MHPGAQPGPEQAHRLGRILLVSGRAAGRPGRHGGPGPELAVLFLRVMVKGLSYAEAGLKACEEQVLETKRWALGRWAKHLGRVVLSSLAELQLTES